VGIPSSTKNVHAPPNFGGLKPCGHDNDRDSERKDGKFTSESLVLPITQSFRTNNKISIFNSESMDLQPRMKLHRIVLLLESDDF